MNKTLVIILSETRAHELTFNNFKKNVIDELNADLCLCIGLKADYDYNNPFYKLAKYKFTCPEPPDYGRAFDYAYNIISQDKPKYECVKDILNMRMQPQSNKNIMNNIINGINKTNNNNLVSQKNIITYRKPLHWREFLKIKDQFLGGIKDNYNQHSGSGGILIFFRWFLLKNLKDNNLINKYDRFIITRSDFIYQLPHPKVDLMNKDNIWIPDGEHYGGYTDRHVVLSKNNIESYLNILNNMVLKSNDYFIKMWNLGIAWNLERLIKFHLEQNNVLRLVKEFPYIMYSVRNNNGTTRWSTGTYIPQLGFYIKYISEYGKSRDYKIKFIKSGSTIDKFYIDKI